MFCKVLILIVTVTVVMGDEDSEYRVGGGGYSYHRFSGPVSGDIRQISVPNTHYNHHGQKQTGHAVDYVAKPDYAYTYGVEDPYTGNSQSRHETRDGDAVHGQYSVLEADGSTRIVKYTADDKNGFQVKVEYVKPGGQQ